MSEATADIDGVDYPFDWPEDTTLLAAMLDAGIPAPHSCTLGQCGACRCTVEGPESTMRINQVLDDFDVRAGDRLACQTVRVPGDTTPAEISYPF
ncbi:(2Fe-2S)-binding protein [Corynebacterium sp. 13CS0277]|uniref:2Fe-2S iron-sulfur cluster-binding protein n=1 Tax=Corynebacterium sp. 13CS0277 TaxID=2071994 RepID=UPI000D03E13C|nr:2Fe-2S iron-sulfur cluster binding domain-containing protein [Corynebacterium sp. 13CS0277]PRQ11551.1 (2Fe-2S)-binding protein [Corynebacterium sp. 13CS0277]